MNQAIRRLDVLDAAERDRILRQWNDTGHEYQSDKCVHQLFEAQAERSPDAVAVVCEEQQLSYAKLNERANRLANRLRTLGVGPEVVVGIYSRREINMIVGVLATLKAGGAYLPLDADLPEARLTLMLEDAQPKVLLVGSARLDTLPGTDVKAISLSEDNRNYSAENPGLPLNASAEMAAYVLYTSGSTGKPKGVVTGHRQIINHIEGVRQRASLRSTSSFAMVQSMSVDGPVTFLFGSLCQGGCLHVISERVALDAEALGRYFARWPMDCLKIAPSHLGALQGGLGSERVLPRSRLLLGGEASRSEWVAVLQEQAPGCVIFNHYGPTETTVGVIMHRVEEQDGGSSTVPLGRPLANTRVYVLDERLEPVPVGVGGELYIAGAGLARGYLRRPGLTAERFVADPYGEPGTRMYRSGDLVRWRVDGNLEFLGRTDHQVKVRGFRIELGEIESALREQEGVRAAVVVAREDEPGEKRLVAYVVLSGSGGVGERELRVRLQEGLRRRLPEYMVPAAVVLLESLPLTPQGKLDGKRLPAPEWRSGESYRAPRSPEEEILCGLFAEVLGVERVGLEDDFFVLGGHSLLATRLVSRVRAVLGVEVPIRTLFESPSVGELSARLHEGGERRIGLLERGVRPERIPLSYAQQRLWFIDRLEGTSTEYNMPQAQRLTGELDREALESAITAMVERHESLRTHFEELDGEPVQVIEAAERVAMPLEDLSGLSDEEQRQRISGAMEEQGREPFDLSRGPVLRVRLLKLGSEEHILLRTLHHIVSDGWSQGVFNRELMVLYEAFRSGRENPLRPLSVQYADFALWQRKWLNEGRLEEGLSYWKEHLAGIPERLELPADRPRPAVQTFAAESCQVLLSEEQTEGLKRLSQQNQSTLYMTLLAAFGVLLSRYSGQDDIVVGSPIANRQDAQLEELIGFFVNSLVLRVRVHGEQSFRELLGEVRRTTLEAYRHQDVPFERLVEELAPQRSLNSSPLYQVVFALQNAPWVKSVLPGVQIETVLREDLKVRMDLEVHSWERSGRLGFYWLYNRDLFDRWRMEQMSRHYVRVLEAVIRDAGVPVGQIEVLDGEERHRILVEWNDTRHDYVGNECVHQLIETQAAVRPEALALVCGEEQLTYGELNERANGVAQLLLDKGIGAEDLVALALPRSVEMVVSILGVLKSGAAYLPLDPDYPSERLRFMVEDARPVCAVTTRAVGATLPGSMFHFVLDSEEVEQQLASVTRRNPVDADRRRKLQPEHPAYVIYTSGSTGTPKGVVVPHGGLAELAGAQAAHFAVTADSRVLQFASFSFDASVWEVSMALTRGAGLVIAGSGERSGAELQGVLVREAVTHVTLPPGVLQTIPGDEGLRLETLIVAGESSWPELVGRWSVGRRMINAYGPTETTVCATMSEALLGEEGASIGRPLGNTRVYVLDERLEPVPVGVGGELYIAGAGLARGYLRRPALTAERFVADPYGEPGTRMYRSGDLVRWRVDGNLEFLGRTDHQVKVRGFRIELGEIESALREQEGVRAAAVVAREDEPGEKRLVAYVVRSPQEEAERENAQASHIQEWKRLYESTYQNVNVGEFAFAGWNSSYTGKPIEAEEMLIWINATVEQLQALHPRKTIEIGCGTGLLLTRLAGQCKSYVGIDFSAEVLNKLGEYVGEREDLHHVELFQGFADDLSFIGDQSVDLVIVNSVTQYFPDVDYFLEVLQEAIRVTSFGGTIFLGDLRNLLLLEAFHSSIQTERSHAGMRLQDLRKQVLHECHKESELLLSPELFVKLGREWDRIGRVKITPKPGAYYNELSRFRYDVHILVGEKEEPRLSHNWVNWDEAGEWRQAVPSLLNEAPNKPVAVRGVKDTRVAEAIEIVNLLGDQQNEEMTVGELRRRCAKVQGEDPVTVMELARELGVELYWQSFKDTGIFNVVFNPEWERIQKEEESPWTHYRAYGNVPWRNVRDPEFGRVLQRSLQIRLPEYMVPAAVVLLESLPLTANGKLDGKRLPAPEWRSGESYRAPRSPEEEILCGLFAEVLGVERVGLEDDFFVLGGHSLLATRLVSRVRAVLGVEVPIRTLFESPSVGELSARLHEGGERRIGLLERGVRPERIPLSYAQQRLWFIDRLEGTSTEYNAPQAQRLTGELDREALESAITAMVERHESLRTHFEELDGEPVQVIEAAERVAMPLEDLSGLSDEEQRQRISGAMEEQGREPFDLSRGPVLRVRLLKLGSEEHILLRTLHHIVSDGWSQGVFNRELMVLYEAFRSGRENPLRPLSVQYADFALWQRKWLNEGRLEEGLSYWKEHLAGIPERLELPADRPRPAVQTFAAESCQVLLSEEQTEGLKRLSQQNQSTLYMTLLAAFGVLLSRYSGQDDIVVGSPIANRQDAQLEELIGFFVNSLVLRVRVHGEQSFRELLGEVRRTTLEAYRHQDVPFERLVEELAPQRSLNSSPLYQVVFALQNAPWVKSVLPGVQIETVTRGELKVRYDLEVQALEQGGPIRLSWRYNRDLFDRWRMEQMSRHYVRVLEAVIRDAGVPVGQIEVLDGEERHRILVEWNDTRHDYVGNECVHQLIETQAAVRPEALALVCGEEQLTYGELNERANGVAQLLLDKGIGAEDLVALALPRSVEMVVSILGVLKSGAAYLPLDPDYPSERLRFMVEDARPVCAVTTRAVGATLPGSMFHFVLDSEEVEQQLASVTRRNPVDADRRRKLQPEHPAYVIYTSGSTGTPKGVVIGQSGLLNMVLAHIERLSLIGESRVLQFSSLNFDVAICELGVAIVSGGTVIATTAIERSSGLLAETIKCNEIDVAFLPTAVLASISEGESLPLLKTLVIGGESSWPELVGRWSVGRRMINAYGPTETTVCATMSEALLGEEGASIGRPLWNTRVYVLDERLEPVPVGVGGELYIAGAGLARGYLRRPGLTAERFVADPYGEPGTRMYRSGDLVRWRVDGNLEFLGRTDHQVKVRGFRIELGEIESALREQEGVRAAAVVAREDEPGEKRLVAYVVLSGSGGVGERELRVRLQEGLRRRLPEYMVPAAVVLLESLPLTANGKLDGKRLPAPEWRSGESYRAPRSPEEEILCGLFAEVLGVERVGLEDDFFVLGGHSLLATRLVSRVRAVLGVEVPIRTLFESPSVGELSARLHEGGERRIGLLERGVRPERIPLSYAQQRLWFIDRLEGTSTEYNAPQAQRLTGELDREALESAITAMVERHESLRTHFEELDGEPVQVIEAAERVAMPLEDLSGLSDEEQRQRISGAMEEQGREPFDLSRGPVLRVRLLKLGSEEHILLRTLHHIVSDGWSQGVFNRELMVLYEAFRSGRENPLRPLSVQYADFALWQRKWLNEGRLEEGLSYWKEHLAGIPERLELPADRPRPAVQTFAAESCQVLLSEEQTEGLKRLSQQNQSTLYMTLLAAFGVLLSRYSGQDDIVVGSPIANRQDAQLEELIGFFVNSLVLRMRVRGEQSFRELLGEVRRTTLEAYRHQDVPFERLVEELAPQRSLNSSPLYQVVFALQNAPWVKSVLPGVQIETVTRGELKVRYDLEVQALEQGGPIRLSWRYNRDLFDRWRMEQMSRHYVRVLEAVIRDAGVPVGQIEVLDGEERHRILVEWNDTRHDYVGNECVHQLIETQAAVRPEALALVCGEEQLTYGELNERANGVAQLLLDKGIGAEDLVALALPRSVEMVVSILGVLKSGAAYLALDPDYPSERLRFMVEDARPVCAVTTRAVGATLPGSMFHFVLDSEEVEQQLASVTRRNPVDADRRRKLQPEHPAYVIYTSGSTGTPKGVVVPHGGLTELAGAQAAHFAVTADSRVLQFASFSFDASVSEVFVALTRGAGLVIAGSGERSGAELQGVLVREAVTHVTLPPGVLQTIPGDEGLRLETLIVAGESSWPELVGRWSVGRRMINAYGPTETTVCATMSEALLGEEGASIGRPLGNTRVYVLDERLEPVPVGVGGELYIAGAGLARGYLRRPALTAERFVADPYGEPGTRMYRSGDLVRWRVDGNLEFLGRTDHQICDAVASTLLQLPSVEECIVIRNKMPLQSKDLIAYIVSPSPLVPTQFERHLKANLFELISSVTYVRVTRLPLTESGYVDHKRLSQIDVIDSGLIAQWEQQLRSLAEVDEAAVVVRDKRKSDSHLDIADLISFPRQPSTFHNAHPYQAPIGPALPSKPHSAMKRPAVSHGSPLRQIDGDVELLTTALLRAANRVVPRGITYISSGGSESRCTYSELLQQAQQTLTGLRAFGLKVGTPVILQLDANQDLVLAFWACALGGFVPAPIAIPRSYEQTNSQVRRLQEAWILLGKPIILTSSHLLSSLRVIAQSPQFTGVNLVDLDTVRSSEPTLTWHSPNPNDLALLLLTSGSSGTPKAVMLSHRNIMSLARGLAELNQLSDQDTSLNWMPLDHVGGLVFFHARDVILGCDQVQIATDYILESPLRWLDYAVRYVVTVTWAPNFAYALINGHAKEVEGGKWDLSHLRILFNGGEAIVPQIAHDFLELLRPFGMMPNAMRPTWGMSETSSAVVFSADFLGIPANASFVELGKPIRGVSLRIVDSDENLLEENQIGNLEISGVTVTQGYYGRPDLNRSVFHEGGWFATGDIGFICEGNLTITGRSKEMIIVNGINYYSHEIESAVESVDGVDISYTAACGVRGSLASTDQLAIFFCSEVTEAEGLRKLLRAIRNRVIETVGVNPHYLIPVDKSLVPKTSIGKIQRVLLRDRFHNGEFDSVIEQIRLLYSKDALLPDWFYRTSWKLKAPIAMVPMTVVTEKVVFADCVGLAHAIVRRVGRHGKRWVVVEKGTTFIKHSPYHYQVKPTIENYSLLFASLLKDNISINEVVHLWGYAGDGAEPDDQDLCEEGSVREVGGLLRLVQAIADAKKTTSPTRLFVAASHSFVIDGNEQVKYEHAAFVGFLKSVEREMPWLRCRFIDLESKSIEADSVFVSTELMTEDRDSVIAYRGMRRFVPRIEKVDVPALKREHVPIKTGGMYLISGGLGGIGVELGKYLLDHYSVRLLLIGRQPLEQEAAEDGTSGRRNGNALRKKLFDQLKRLGGDVAYVAVDVCDGNALRSEVDKARLRWSCELDGIFHLAGVFEEMQIVDEAEQHLLSALRPKLYGALCLSKLLEDKKDKLFVAFSSLNGLFGGFGVSAYAAACSAMDSFCGELRCKSRMRVNCISWSRWNNIGMSPDFGAEEASRRRGYEVIEIEKGIGSLLVALLCDEAQLLVGVDGTNANIQRFVVNGLLQRDQLQAHFVLKNPTSPLHEKLGRVVVVDRVGKRTSCEFFPLKEMPRAADGGIDEARLGVVRGHGDTAKGVAPQNQLEEQILRIWEEVLEKSGIGVQDNFFDLGGHSLLAMRVISRVKGAFQANVPVRRLFESPTIGQFAEVIEEILLDEVQEISEEEAVRLTQSHVL